MPARTVKGMQFTIVVGEQEIVVKHVHGKGRRCRVVIPRGARIETCYPNKGIAAGPLDAGTSSND